MHSEFVKFDRRQDQTLLRIALSSSIGGQHGPHMSISRYDSRFAAAEQFQVSPSNVVPGRARVIHASWQKHCIASGNLFLLRSPSPC